MTDFVHLHCHTDRSFLDGVGRSSEYAELAQSRGQKALAITDHGNLHGLPEHKRACEKFGIKPIYGCEMYANDKREEAKQVRADIRAEKLDKKMVDPTFTDAHIVLLAENNEGWRSLLELNRDAVRNGYYYKPRTTHDMILRHSQGLIATTACMGSQFNRLLLQGRTKVLRALLSKFKDSFGDRFYYEMQVNESPDQKKINELLSRECKGLGIEPLLTNDVHYACAGDCDRQDEMVSVARHTPMDDPKYWKLTARHLWFAGPKDMIAAARSWGYFIDKALYKRAIQNTVAVAERCNADIYGDGTLNPPRYLDASGKPVEDSFKVLWQKALDGFNARFKGGSDEHYKRMKYELSTIKTCGMADFYLVTLDIVDYCRSRGIFFWTRGSGCASLVAALVGITPIDPVRFGLLFERFVDPNRANAPDFDLDIEHARRAEVIAWLIKKYGGKDGENIARILSLSTFGLKGAIRDVCMARGVDNNARFSLADACDQIDAVHEKRLAVAKVADRDTVVTSAMLALEKHAKGHGKRLLETQPDVVRAAMEMVGRVYGRTQHAAGYVVAPKRLSRYMPIDRLGSGDAATITTAWGEGLASQDIGPTGLMKVDLLGLVTCTVVRECVDLASKRSGRDVRAEIDGWSMNFDDKRTAAEYATGNGFGLHQMQEGGQFLAGFAKRLKPSSVADVTAMVALYRPGSLDYLDEYLLRAHKKRDVQSVDPVFDAVNAETYGIMVYQEQVMRVLHELGGLALRDAYGVIKAISKQSEEKVEAARKQFVKGAMRNGKTSAQANELFDMVQKFAGYGFNKAHAASYAVLSWITAYLRSRYPSEFYWAWLNSTDNVKEKKGERRVESFMRAATRSGIRVLRPNIARSSSRWRISSSGALVAPLSLIVGVGDDSADAIRAAYKKHRWPDIWKFMQWCDENKRVVNSKTLRALAQSGALAPLMPNQFHAYDIASLFGDLKTTKRDGSRVAQIARMVRVDAKAVCVTPDEPEVALSFERAAFGFSFWSNPWSMNNRARKVVRLVEDGRIADENERRVRGRRRAFHVVRVHKHIDKKENEMAFATFETPSGQKVEAICFSSAWKQHKRKLVQDNVCLVGGEFDGKGVYIIDSGANAVLNIDKLEVRGG